MPTMFRNLITKPKAPVDTSIRLIVNSGTDRQFGIPVCGSIDYNYNQPYNWLVEWGDGTTETLSGGSGTNKLLYHTYPNVNTNYTIKINPIENKRGWLKAFANGPHTSLNPNSVKVRKVYGEFSQYKLSFNDDEPDQAKLLFYKFENAVFDEESFSFYQDATMVGAESLISTFSYCNFVNITDKMDLSRITKVAGINPSRFCNYMFSLSNITKISPKFNIPQLVGLAPNDCFGYMFSSTIIDFENTNITIPPNVIINNGFMSFFAFKNNSKAGIIKLFNDKIFTVDELNKTYVFSLAFSQMVSLAETLNPTTLKALTVSPTATNSCFKSSANISGIPTNWK